MDREIKEHFKTGIITVFFALIVNSFIGGFFPWSFTLLNTNISVGFLVSGGIGALLAGYVRKSFKF